MFKKELIFLRSVMIYFIRQSLSKLPDLIGFEDGHTQLSNLCFKPKYSSP